MSLRRRVVVAGAPDGSGGCVLQTRLESGADLYWRLGPGLLEAVDAPASGTLVSFTPDDHRVRSARPLSVEGAKSLAIRETGSHGRVRVVNLSRRSGLVYATAAERLQGLGCRVVPGLQLLDALMRQHGLEAPMVAGFVFEAAAQGTRLAILYAMADEGPPALSVSINPADMEQTIALFVNSARLPQDTRAVVFTGAEMLGSLAAASAYPQRAEWQGIPLHLLWRCVAWGAWSAFAGTAAWAATAYMQHVQAEQRYAAADARSAARRVALEGLRATRPLAVSREAALDPDALLGVAEALWLPGTRVAIDARAEATTYTIILALQRPPARGGAAAQGTPADAARVAALMEAQPPAGCVRLALETAESFDEIKVALRCAAARAGAVAGQPD